MVRRPQFDRREVLLAVAAQFFWPNWYRVLEYFTASTSASLFCSPRICKLVACQRFAIPSQAPLILIANQTADCKRALRLAGMTDTGITLALGGGFSRGFAHLGVLEVLEQERMPDFQNRRHKHWRLARSGLCGRHFIYAICAILAGACAFAIFFAFIRGNPAPASKEKIASVNSFKHGFELGRWRSFLFQCPSWLRTWTQERLTYFPADLLKWRSARVALSRGSSGRLSMKAIYWLTVASWRLCRRPLPRETTTDACWELTWEPKKTFRVAGRCGENF